jgi:signal transduction histidine kinase
LGYTIYDPQMTSNTISAGILQKAFPGMSQEEGKGLIASGKIVFFPKDTAVCHEGTFETSFYVILDGEVKVTKLINNEEVRVLNYLHTSDYFGEMAIIHEAPRAATVTTTKPTTLLEIGKEAFSQAIEHSSAMSLAMVRQVSQRLRSNDDMAIADLRNKTEELSRAYEQLSDLERARNEFLTTIAHELRTPLMAASGFLQVIKVGKLQGEALTSALETVSNNLKEIITITNNILFLQEMDLILPEFQPIDIGSVVAAAMEQQRSHAEQNNIGLKLSIAPGLPKIKADSKSLERAVAAILDNAIKFSPDGGNASIEVNGSENDVNVKITDSGVGIPEEARIKIFDRFFHLDQVEGHMFRGAGLGLSIARQVIEMHHGRIEAESKTGLGTTITIHLYKN